MQESDTASKTFLGVRFCLYGFDPINEHKVRVKLVDNGGVGVGQYSRNCTHLIVDKIVYDDPLCVAARNDGKTVITGLWVDHSFDVGMPVDATSIMYRPIRDLSGIPGAKSLVVCLTGYQRQDREDIMTMVSLMGAQFSKPLVASRVTHLICYKFEGEKYELAKKIKKIKLINHLWLEDCLREWEILSEANYSKSGYELEVMEAEAKDSDEEAEETTMKHFGQQSLNRSPPILRSGMLSSIELPTTVEVSNSTMPRHSPKTKEVLVPPGKSHLCVSFNNVNDPEFCAFHDSGFRDVSSIKPVQPDNGSPSCANMDNKLASTSRSPSLSNQMFTAISYSKKSPRTSTPPNLSREVSCQSMKIRGVSDISSSKMQQLEEGTSSCLVRSPQKGSDLCHGEDSAGILPQKRALKLSGSSTKSQKLSRNAKASVKGNAEQWEPTSLVSDLPQVNDYYANETSCLNGLHSSCADNLTAKLSTDLFSSKTVTPEDRKNSSAEKSPSTSFSRGSTLAGKPNMQNEIAYVKSPKMSLKGLRESTSASRSNIRACNPERIQVVGEPDELLNKQQDVEVPSLDYRKLLNENSHSHSNLNLLGGGNDKLLTKPVSKPDMQNENAYEKSPQVFFKGLRESTSASKSNIGEYGLEPLRVVEELGELQNKQQDVEVPSHDEKILGNENSHSPSNIDLLEGGNGKLVTKPVSKKLVKKTLGSRSKLSNIANRKGSIYSIKIASENHSTIALNGENGRATCKSSSERETSPPTINLGAAKDVKEVVKCQNSLTSKTQFMDDETQSPDEEDDYDPKKTSEIEKSEMVELTHKVDIFVEVEHASHDFTQHGSPIASEKITNETDLERAVVSKDSDFGEPTLKHGGLKKKANKRKKQLYSITVMKADPSNSKNDLVGENSSVPKNVEEMENEKESVMPHPVAKPKGSTAFVEVEISGAAAPDEEDNNDPKKTAEKEKSELIGLTRKAETFVDVEHVGHDSIQHGSPIPLENRMNVTDPEKAVSSKNSDFGRPTLRFCGLKKKARKTKKQLSSRVMMKADPSSSKNDLVGEDSSIRKNVEETENETKNVMLLPAAKPKGSTASSKVEISAAPDEEDENDGKKTAENEKPELIELTHKTETFVEVEHVSHDSIQHGSPIALDNRNETDPEKTVGSNNSDFDVKCGSLKKKASKRKKQPSSRAMMKADPSNSKNDLVGENSSVRKNVEETKYEKENVKPHPAPKPKGSTASKVEISGATDESSPVHDKEIAGKSVCKPNSKTLRTNEKSQKVDSNREPLQKVLNRVKNEPLCFILSGHRLQRKEFQQVIRGLKVKFCRDSHQWSYQATHFIAPDPIRRTEKFFAAAASGRWILKPDYLSACNQAGKFLAEEPYEWHKNGLTEDGAINLEAPRKWRQLRERTSHGAFYGMRIIVYGECIAPPLDTLKRVVKAGDGDLLATSPPYTRFLKSGVDFAVVSPSMPRVDMWVQEFFKHEVPCIVADYLVEYVCKPGYSLERHVLYNTHEWAERSFTNLTSRMEEIVEDSTPESPNDSEGDDITCQVCGSGDRGVVMLICGDENGSIGCGIGTHIDCCDPPLDVVPEEDWFCPKCVNITTSSKKGKKGASRSKG